MSLAKKLFLATALLGLGTLAACGKNTGKTCLDRVADKCGPVAKRDCNLPATASPAELEKCAAYAACKNSVMLGCASQK